MFKVEYVSEGGTYDDNEFIGVYTTKADAEWAKLQYIKDQMGYESKAKFKLDNPSCSKDDLMDWVEQFTDLKEQIYVESVINLYTR
jgi:hypothetical protein